MASPWWASRIESGGATLVRKGQVRNGTQSTQNGTQWFVNKSKQEVNKELPVLLDVSKEVDKGGHGVAKLVTQKSQRQWWQKFTRVHAGATTNPPVLLVEVRKRLAPQKSSEVIRSHQKSPESQQCCPVLIKNKPAVSGFSFVCGWWQNGTKPGTDGYAVATPPQNKKGLLLLS